MSIHEFILSGVRNSTKVLGPPPPCAKKFPMLFVFPSEDAPKKFGDEEHSSADMLKRHREQSRTSFSWENRSGPAIRIDEDSRRWSTKQSKCIKSTSATPTVRNNHGEKTAPNHRLQTHYFGPSTLAQVHQFSNHRPDCLHRINARKIPDKMTRAWHLQLGAAAMF